ncbi:MAG: type II toxin-antitoxin system PemK/MazF family toxin [Gemmatimonadota bacterium]|nr:type II toxin-antitoxin system PemK/MazF family toxin [Gemmatimonadota bacterium]
MNGRPQRGEVWLYTFKPPDKRRPVVILTRQSVLPLLRTAMVAPVTSNIRGLPSEVPVGVDEGLKHSSVVNVDWVQTVEQRLLTHYVGSLGEARMAEVCRALSIATGCD